MLWIFKNIHNQNKDPAWKLIGWSGNIPVDANVKKIFIGILPIFRWFWDCVCVWVRMLTFHETWNIKKHIHVPISQVLIPVSRYSLFSIYICGALASIYHTLFPIEQRDIQRMEWHTSEIHAYIYIYLCFFSVPLYSHICHMWETISS